jgi:hypothetical protein
MKQEIERQIMSRIENPGWVTSRGILTDPSGQENPEERLKIEEAMKSLAEQGRVNLWRLILEADGSELVTVARPDLELDKELEQRGAWAKAIRQQI